MKNKLLRFLSLPAPVSASVYGDYFARLPVLETPSLVLRPMLLSDAREIFRAMQQIRKGLYRADPGCGG